MALNGRIMSCVKNLKNKEWWVKEHRGMSCVPGNCCPLGFLKLLILWVFMKGPSNTPLAIIKFKEVQSWTPFGLLWDFESTTLVIYDLSLDLWLSLRAIVSSQFPFLLKSNSRHNVKSIRQRQLLIICPHSGWRDYWVVWKIRLICMHLSLRLV